MTITDEQRLRAAGLRVTRERLGVVSTQAVHDCLEALGPAGLVPRVETAGSPARYQTARQRGSRGRG